MSTWDVGLGLFISVTLTIYLIYALIRPENF